MQRKMFVDRGQSTQKTLILNYSPIVGCRIERNVVLVVDKNASE